MVAIPVMSTVSAGGTLTAALWNGQVRDAENFFLSVPNVIVTQATPQAFATSTYAALLWDTEVRDNDSAHSTVTNTSRFTIVTPGWYEFGGTVGWAGSTVGNRLSKWMLNGTLINGTECTAAATLATTSGFTAVSSEAFLNTGDFLELFGWQSTGGSLSTFANGSRAYIKWTGQ